MGLFDSLSAGPWLAAGGAQGLLAGQERQIAQQNTLAQQELDRSLPGRTAAATLYGNLAAVLTDPDKLALVQKAGLVPYLYDTLGKLGGAAHDGDLTRVDSLDPANMQRLLGIAGAPAGGNPSGPAAPASLPGAFPRLTEGLANLGGREAPGETVAGGGAAPPPGSPLLPPDSLPAAHLQTGGAGDEPNAAAGPKLAQGQPLDNWLLAPDSSTSPPPDLADTLARLRGTPPPGALLADTINGGRPPLLPIPGGPAPGLGAPTAESQARQALANDLAQNGIAAPDPVLRSGNRLVDQPYWVKQDLANDLAQNGVEAPDPFRSFNRALAGPTPASISNAKQALANDLAQHGVEAPDANRGLDKPLIPAAPNTAAAQKSPEKEPLPPYHTDTRAFPNQAPVPSAPQNPLNDPLAAIDQKVTQIVGSLPTFSLGDAKNLSQRFVDDIKGDPRVAQAAADYQWSLDPANHATLTLQNQLRGVYYDTLGHAISAGSQFLQAALSPYSAAAGVSNEVAQAIQALGAGLGSGSKAGTDLMTALATAKHNATQDQIDQVKPLLATIEQRWTERTMAANSIGAGGGININIGVPGIAGVGGGLTGRATQSQRTMAAQLSVKTLISNILALREVGIHGNPYAKQVADGYLKALTAEYNTNASSVDVIPPSADTLTGLDYIHATAGQRARIWSQASPQYRHELNQDSALAKAWEGQDAKGYRGPKYLDVIQNIGQLARQNQPTGPVADLIRAIAKEGQRAVPNAGQAGQNTAYLTRRLTEHLMHPITELDKDARSTLAQAWGIAQDNPIFQSGAALGDRISRWANAHPGFIKALLGGNNVFGQPTAGATSSPPRSSGAPPPVLPPVGTPGNPRRSGGR